MTVEELFVDVEHAIHQIGLSPSILAKDYDFYARGALVLVASIPDHLLEEYNQKYYFGITGDRDRLTTGAMQEKVYGVEDPKEREMMQSFLTDFIRGKRKLRGWQRVKFVLDNRNLSVHRRSIEVGPMHRPGVGHSAGGHVFFGGTSRDEDWTAPNLLGFTLEKMKDFVRGIRHAHP